MKSLKILAILICLITAGSAKAQMAAYTISGKFHGNNPPQKIYFIQGNFQNEPLGKAREIPVQKGIFHISGKISEPVPAFLSLTEHPNDNGASPRQFILDGGNITVDIPGQLSSASVKGSKAEDDMQQFTRAEQQFAEKLNKLNYEAQALGQSGMLLDSIKARINPRFKALQDDLSVFKRKFISQNPDSYISILMLSDLASTSQNFILADSLWNTLSAAVKDGPTARGIHEYIKLEKKTSLGLKAPDFSLRDTAGHNVKLSSLAGKYVLIDFWASWCGPCRMDNPNVVRAYQQFRNKNFTILGVSLDRDKNSWIKAIRADGLTWTHVSDLQYWNNAAAVMYGVQSIPKNFLIDPQGVIVGRNLHGEELQKKLSELLN